MKKKIYFLLILLMICSCSNNDEEKMLNCRYENEDVIGKIEIVYNNAGTEMLSMIVENKVYIGDVVASEDQLKEDCDLYSEANGVTCSASIEEEYYIYTLKYDLSKTTDEFLKKDNFVKTDYETYKSDLENAEYICN